MGHTACTEPQCLYKGALYLYLTIYLLHPISHVCICTMPFVLVGDVVISLSFYMKHTK
jgi:hypothetical protein